ncbi:MAG: anthranilate phosphoribosyltransferase [Myxococcaceae bacterium]
MIQAALQRLMNGESLSRAQTAEVMREVASGAASQAQIGAFLTALRLKGETADEIAGAAEVMRELLSPVRVTHATYVDICGTGGDGANTFNISTAAAFVVAGAGVAVAKHGNRSVSSRCGSADVLTALGVNIHASVARVEACITEAGIGFCFAPQHHPAFKAVATLRKELGVRTVFNLLGPLANPARAKHQVMGVYDARWVPVVGRVLQSLGAQHAFVVHGSGLDEISVSSSTRVCEVTPSDVKDYELTPEALGLSRWDIAALAGGEAEENARIVLKVLRGDTGAPRDAVVANAAAAIVAGGAAPTLIDGVARAQASIDSGAARKKLEALRKLSQE